ncbi:hypothetical protein HD806DRAFT_510333 [Xylariaceae sp. AK1471]|nr:hypothetical protein HD806DRAFT_510333 [Xylariaceae sp. AK1471]
MKITLAFVALLPALGAASCLAERGEGKLPTVDLQSLSPDQYALANIEQDGTNHGIDTVVSARQTCPSNYPWYCDGRCCQYNRCCTATCCGLQATFCGSDGYCYYYT